jgi:hypothetical protein
MKERVNKPRAFLSYSSQDLSFIERIESDLRKCKIDTWRDRTEIRDGQPWLESIFEEGLPTCDVIIAYFTYSAVSSGMVAKEVDAAQIRQLKDSGVTFLPYVNNSEIRDELRLDIQRLQCRVWNDENYNEILPSVVAEIWCSYMERNIGNAVLHERNRRLELEIQLQELKAQSNASGFTSQEEKEFRYIYGKLDEPREILIRSYNENATGRANAKFSFLKLLLSFIGAGHTVIEGLAIDDKSTFKSHVLEELNKAYPKGGFLAPELKENPRVELVTYGFVEPKDNLFEGPYHSYDYTFTPRLYRFRFWLEVNNLCGETPLFEVTHY